jgi:hypothetical protein
MSARNARYKKTAKGKAANRRYVHSAKGKATRARNRRSQRAKARRVQYERTPAGKARGRERVPATRPSRRRFAVPKGQANRCTE